MRWTEVKRHLDSQNEREILNLIRDLYDLSADNKRLVQSRLTPPGHSNIATYKRDIARALNPDFDKPIDLRRGRKVIADYKKALPNDKAGLLDLMLCYVESGNAQTMEYGDIDARFYDSLCSMLDRIAETAPATSAESHKDCVQRLRKLADIVNGQIGWGYADHLNGITDDIEATLQAR